jgi:BTB/POZ domain
MSTTPLELASNMLTSDKPPANILFEPCTDIILRSRDSRYFRVSKSHIVNSSPILDKLIRRAQDPPDDANDKGLLPMVELPDSGAIIRILLTFVFSVTPLVPSTTEQTMELLSVAQKYQMVSVLARIRGSIARQNPPATGNLRDTALYMYALAQQYGLRQEALQAARTIVKYPMSIEDLEDKLDIMPGASLYELWKYYDKVRTILSSDLTEFRTSSARSTLTDIQCFKSSSSQIPCWLDDYIVSVGEAPHLCDFIEIYTTLLRHLDESTDDFDRCACKTISGQTIRTFLDALASIVDASFQKVRVIDVYELLTTLGLKSLQAESALSLVQELEDTRSKVNSTTSLPEPLDVPDANLILRSSDLVNFRVHKPVLAMASPFFKDLLSLPQPSDSESVDGLPVVQLTEDAELLHSLVSMLYPIPSVIPDSYDKVLYLLAACQKYDMGEVQSYIRAEVTSKRDRCDPWEFPQLFDSHNTHSIFRTYAIASDKRLIPEMEDAARLTLDHPMTFMTLGEGLRFFQGSALRDLARFRKRCGDNIISCLKSSLEVDVSGPSNIWVGCPSAGRSKSKRSLPTWLCQVLSWKDLKSQVFTHPLPTPSSIRERYLKAIQTHDDCTFCLQVHAKNGSNFGSQLENKLAYARKKVYISLF